MIRVSFARVRPEMVGRLTAWFAELGSRREEVLATFAQEHTRHEQVFILPGHSGPILVYVMDADNFAHAARAYADSKLPIDREHRAVLKACLMEPLRIEPLFDLSAPGTSGTLSGE